MNRKIITTGFLKMLTASSSDPMTDAASAATMERMREEQRWRAYDRPACRRFVSQRPRVKRQPDSAAPFVGLPNILRRQAE